MRTRQHVLILLLATWMLTSGALAPMHPARAGPARTVTNKPYPPKFRAQVREALRHGIEYVQKLRRWSSGSSSDSVRFEQAAALTWVLRRAGGDSYGREDEERFEILDRHAPESVAEASLLIRALCAQPAPDGDPFAVPGSDAGAAPIVPLSKRDRTLVLRTVKLLLAAQVMHETLPAGAKEHLPREAPQIEELGGWSGLTGLGGDEPRISDVPSTSLALLALESARRHGVAVPTEHFVLALDLFLRWQALEGTRTTLRLSEVRGDERREWSVAARARGFGWTGSRSDRPTGYETASAAVGLAICKDALRGQTAFTPDLQRRTDTALQDALAWIQRHYTVARNPDPHRQGAAELSARLRLQWLRALADLALYARMRFVGTHDWYQEGAAALMRKQASDGSWPDSLHLGDQALLFLQRASLRCTAPVLAPEEG